MYSHKNQGYVLHFLDWVKLRETPWEVRSTISEVRGAQGKLVEEWKEESYFTFRSCRDKTDTSPAVSEATAVWAGSHQAFLCYYCHSYPVNLHATHSRNFCWDKRLSLCLQTDINTRLFPRMSCREQGTVTLAGQERLTQGCQHVCVCVCSAEHLHIFSFDCGLHMQNYN